MNLNPTAMAGVSDEELGRLARERQQQANEVQRTAARLQSEADQLRKLLKARRRRKPE